LRALLLLAIAAPFALGAAIRGDAAAGPPVAAASGGLAPFGPAAAGAVDDPGCVSCHGGIEEMHPGFPLSCTDCHGGDGEAKRKDDAHVQPRFERPNDETVPPNDFDLAHARFVNPTDLRVAERVCGDCHGELVQHLMTSLHGTTAAHLSDGFFEMGLNDERTSPYAVFGTEAPDGHEGEVDRLVQPPALDRRDDPMDIASHFPDLIRKECMQCHLWSEGRAVRGRVGFDGEYRGDGCAACHVPYRTDGLSESLDPTVDRVEPGHPRRHQLVTHAPTQTCTTCHYGDASIGLHFRGLSQLPPGAPGGPEIDGTTDALLHRAFFVNDPAVTPPDVHHASGLHCVDCHTLQGVMGDGRMPSKMEEATEITCEACHGTFDERTDMRTQRGTRLEHLFDRDHAIWMRSKVTGEEHRIKQAVDVLDVAHPDYNERAAEAMNGAHGDVACYTCHGGWNVNFLGFHFYRNEALSQLDLLTGDRTPGRVTTQEKVFTTWKSFYAGFDEKGRVAPYLTGFSTMGTVDGPDGERILDQEFPVTSNGLSGLTMIHHQLHSTRPTARSCVECHRASETWGMGSSNFQLGRQVAFAADRRGIEVVAFDRENPQASVALGRIVQPDVVDIEVRTDHLHGHAQTIYVTEGKRGLHAIDARDPRELRRLDFHMSVEPRGMALVGSHLLLADGVGGVKVFDVSDPAELDHVATVPTVDAYDVEVRWPYAYVADGAGGLVVLDVRIPTRPEVVGGLPATGEGVIDVAVLFQYSRPTVGDDGAPADRRTEARRLVAFLDETAGFSLVDATEPAHLDFVEPESSGESSASRRDEDVRYRGLALRSHVDVASPQGGQKTTERDVLYVVEEELGDDQCRVRTWDVSDAAAVRRLGDVRLNTSAEMLAFGAWYTTPFLRPMVIVPGQEGVYVADVSRSEEPVPLGAIAGFERAYVFAAERFPLDRMLDADGRRLKDVSHPGSRWLMRGEIEAVLAVEADALGTIGYYDQPSVASASSARSILARADRDLSGVLTGDELESAVVKAVRSADRDGDGRITLAELDAFAATGEGRTDVLEPEAAFADGPGGRVGRDGDLARLLDGIDPFEFDRRGDGVLDRRETEDAVFAALDLDGDGRLDVHEQSRQPGEARELRFGLGGEKPSRMSRRSFHLRDEDWDALDVNGDGHVQLDLTLLAERRRRGEEPPQPEWPVRRRYEPIDLPPGVRAEVLLEAFDDSGDGRITKSEMRRRPGLFARLDIDGTTVLEEDEIERAATLVLRWGLETVPDDFVTRWDLDGSGEVEPDELPRLARTLLARRPALRRR